MKRVWILLATALFFVAVNVFLYVSITQRLANNFSGTSQMKMIDVGRYLPFESGSDLARTGSSLTFSKDDDLPVLDGAAALVPVYASVIENCYPAGTVTYEGGAFSDDNKYGENFAEDSIRTRSTDTTHFWMERWICSSQHIRRRSSCRTRRTAALSWRSCPSVRKPSCSS